MEGLLRKNSIGGKYPKRLQSDPVGNHLRGVKDESEHLKTPIHTRNNIKYLATHNINSLLQIGKLKTLTNILDQHNIIIAGLQEMRNTDQEAIETQGYRVYKGIPGRRVLRSRCPQFGTGFIVNLKYTNIIKEFKAITPRLATLTIKSLNKTYTIINGHAPTNDKNSKKEYKQETEEFWDTLEQTTINIPKHHVKILIGDYNAQLGTEKKFRDIIGKWTAQKRTNKNGMRLIEFCRNHNLISKSTYFMRKPNKLKTWKHPDWKKGEYQLDHVCMDKNHHKEIQNVKIMRGVDTGSDHYMVKIKMRFTPQKKEKHQKQKKNKKYNTQTLINNEQYKNRTQTLKTEDNDIIKITKELQRIAEEIAPIQKRKKHPWWDEECNQALEERHKAWVKYQNNKTDNSEQEFRNQRKDTQKILKRKKKQFQKDIITQIETDNQKSNPRDYYKTFKYQLKKYNPPTLMLKDKQGKIAHSNQENAEILAETFKELLTSEEPTELLEINTETQIKTPCTKIEPPTFAEVKEAIKEMKNYKASGEDGTTAEIWKYAAETTQKKLHQMLTEIWEREELPEHWTEATIVPIYKKGEKTNPDNYRGISLLDCTYKIFSRIIYNRCKEQLEKELGDYQGGFRPWRSCADQVITLKLIMDYYKRRQKQMSIAFIDFKKAYDSIHRKSLLKILRHLGLHPKLVKMIELTLTKTRSKIKFRGNTSKLFTIHTGLRQGDGLSPLLFNCTLEYIIREWEKTNPKDISIGAKRHNIRLNCLGFADDLALLADDISTTRKQISDLEQLANKVGLKISYEKTKIMMIDPLLIDKVKINEHQIDIVKEFKYLGEVIQHDGKEKRTWEERTKKLSKSQQLTRNTYNKKCLSINTKLKHYKTVVQPEVTYCSETIFKLHQKNQVDKILKIERRIIRTCINKKHLAEEGWRLIPNNTVYKEVEPITDYMRKKRISYFGHILRMPEERTTKRIVTRMFEQKTTANWIREIKEDMQELDLTKEDLINKTEKTKTLKDKDTRFKIRHDNRATCIRVFSEQTRKERSERMKDYWRKIKEKNSKRSNRK